MALRWLLEEMVRSLILSPWNSALNAISTSKSREACFPDNPGAWLGAGEAALPLAECGMLIWAFNLCKWRRQLFSLAGLIISSGILGKLLYPGLGARITSVPQRGSEARGCEGLPGSELSDPWPRDKTMIRALAGSGSVAADEQRQRRTPHSSCASG